MKRKVSPSPRLEPDLQLCPKFDDTGIALFPVAECPDMGMRILDNCAQEHIM